METEQEKINYNEEPVHYCHDCLYLGNPKVVEEFNIEYCPYCGSTDFYDSSIEEWERKFELKYKQGKFLNINKTWKTITEELNRR
jgi:hypothetical protein